MPENSKDSNNKELEHTETSAYKPAYKEKSKKVENQAQELPSELAEIVSVWPELPAHIKEAIKALIQIHNK